MQRVIMKSKIYGATVTQSVIDFDGSCGIAPDLMRAAGTVANNGIREQAAIA